jgi:transposase-like protein
MNKPHKHYTAVEKVAILRRHVVERMPVSDICDQYRIQPSLFYNWQRQFFENGAAAFEQPRTAPKQDRERVIAALRDKLQHNNEVVAELMGEHVKLKKRTWGTLTGTWVPHDIGEELIDYVRYPMFGVAHRNSLRRKGRFLD